MHFVRSTVARVVFLLAVSAAPAISQVALATVAEARGAKGGQAVATLFAAATVTTGVTNGSDVLVTIDGWVDESRLAGKRDSFPVSVGGTQTLRIRATPSFEGKIMGELRPGAGVQMLGMSGTWAHVRRGVWIPASALGRSAAPAAGGMSSATAPAPAPASATAPAAGSLSAVRATKLLTSPAGRALGELPPGTVVQPVTRDRGWVRVRVEGWVQERDFSPADSSFGMGLTAADLRADPAGMVGRMVRWEVQVLSLQTADPLRRDMAPDEPYLLARGPGSESALLYLAVPPSLLNEAKAIAPLTVVTITAKVRIGHSEPVGTPILDIKTISRR